MARFIELSYLNDENERVSLDATLSDEDIAELLTWLDEHDKGVEFEDEPKPTNVVNFPPVT